MTKGRVIQRKDGSCSFYDGGDQHRHMLAAREKGLTGPEVEEYLSGLKVRFLSGDYLVRMSGRVEIKCPKCEIGDEVLEGDEDLNGGVVRKCRHCLYLYLFNSRTHKATLIPEQDPVAPPEPEWKGVYLLEPEGSRIARPGEIAEMFGII